jgi:hypothetical protein
MQVKAPNPDYTGEGPHGVAFINGKGATWSVPAIQWFARKGYGLAQDEFDTEATIKAAEGEGVDPTATVTGRASEDAAESVTMTQAQRQDAYGIGVGTLLPPGHSITGAPAIDAGLPQLSHGQRQALREYLDEREKQDRNAQGPTAVQEGSANKAVKAAASAQAKTSRAKNSRSRKSTGSKKTSRAKDTTSNGGSDKAGS